MRPEAREPVRCLPDDGLLRRVMRVRSVEGGEVLLEAERANACCGCAARTGCGAGVLSEFTGGTQLLRLPSSEPLSPGDEVIVAMADGAFLGAAAKAYMLPPLALAVTASACLAAGLSDPLTGLACAGALVLAFLPLRRADRAAARRPELWIEGPAEASLSPAAP